MKLVNAYLHGRQCKHISAIESTANVNSKWTIYLLPRPLANGHSHPAQQRRYILGTVHREALYYPMSGCLYLLCHVIGPFHGSAVRHLQNGRNKVALHHIDEGRVYNPRGQQGYTDNEHADGSRYHHGGLIQSEPQPALQRAFHELR